MPEPLRVRVAACATLVATALLLAVLAVQTARQGDRLRAVGWSPVRRTPTEWPSLLALMPGGWLVASSFAGCGVAALLLADSVRLVAAGHRRVATVALLMIAVGLFGVTFSADLPRHATTWHGELHDIAYNLIPLGAIVSMTVSLAARREPGKGTLPGWLSGTLLVVLLASIALTRIDSIAQLARYFVLGALTGWLVAIAVSLLRVASRADR